MNTYFLIPVIIACSGLCSGLYAQDSSGKTPPPSITVSGSGTVFADPDNASVRLGAEAQAPNAAAAQQEVNKIVATTIAAIKKLGIPDKNIATAGINLNPVYSDQRAVNSKPETPRIVAFRASNTVRVRTEDLSKIGPIIDAGIQSGANTIAGLDFSLRNDTKQREEALDIAAKEAKSKADAIARALGIQIFGVLEVNEGGVSIYQPRMEMAQYSMKADFASTPVQSGQVQVQASLTVKYKIQQ